MYLSGAIPERHFGHLVIGANSKQIVTKLERQTYSLLDLLGDIGGLNDALYLIIEFIMKSYSGFW